MLPDPPFHQQETDYSCAPACLQWVLAQHGVVKTEEEIRELSDCTFLGTDALNLVEAARKLGFAGTRKYNLTFEELKAEAERRIFPIAYLCLPGIQEHAVVVVSVTEREVVVHDPARGKVVCSKTEFLSNWNLMRCLTILIEE